VEGRSIRFDSGKRRDTACDCRECQTALKERRHTTGVDFIPVRNGRIHGTGQTSRRSSCLREPVTAIRRTSSAYPSVEFLLSAGLGRCESGSRPGSRRNSTRRDGPWVQSGYGRSNRIRFGRVSPGDWNPKSGGSIQVPRNEGRRRNPSGLSTSAGAPPQGWRYAGAARIDEAICDLP